MSHLRRITLQLFLLLFACWTAQAEETLSTAPELRAASPFASSVWQIDVDSDERYLVISTAEGNATIFDLRAFPTKSDTLRIPSRDRQQTRGIGVAISPNAELVAIAAPPLVETNGLIKFGTGAIYIFNNIFKRGNNRIIHAGESGANGLTIPTRSVKLKFSPDGAFLVALLSYGCGVRVWETSTWMLVGYDDDEFAPSELKESRYCGSEAQAGETKDILSKYTGFDILFRGNNANNVWFTVSTQSGLRNYRKTPGSQNNLLKRVAYKTASEIGLDQSRSIALDVAEKNLAVGDDKALRVALLDPDTLEPLSPSIIEVPKAYIKEEFRNLNDYKLPEVAWLNNEGREWLYAGGFLTTERLSAEGRQQVVDTGSRDRDLYKDAANNLIRWPLPATNAKPELLAFGTETVMALRKLTSAPTIAIAELNSVGLITLDADNRPAPSYIGRKKSLDFRAGSIAVSGDGTAISVSNYPGSDEHLRVFFDAKKIERESKSAFQALPFDSNEAKLKLGEWGLQKPYIPEDVTGQKETWTRPFDQGLPKFFNKSFEPAGVLLNPKMIDQYEWSRDVAVSRDRRLVLWGTSHALRLVEDSGDFVKVSCARRMKYETYLVAFADDNRLAITAQSDGTIRWYRIQRQGNECEFKPLLALYAEQTESNKWSWVVSKPDGHFFSIDLRENLLGWQSNETSGQVLFGDITNNMSLFFSSEVGKALDRVSQDVATDKSQLELALKSGKTAYRIDRVDTEIVELHHIQPVSFRIRISGIETEGAPLEADLLIWGVQVKTSVALAGGNPVIYNNVPMRFERSGEYTITFSLPPRAQQQQGQVKMALEYRRARSSYLTRSKPESIPINNFKWLGPVLSAFPGRTFAVLVGFSGYKNFKPLDYASKDAIDIARVLLSGWKREISATSNAFQTSDLRIRLFLSYSSDEQERAAEVLLESLRVDAANIGAQLGKDAEEILVVKSQIVTKDTDDSELGPVSEHKVKDQLQKFADETREASDKKDTLIFYFSGHGASAKLGGDDPKINDYYVGPYASHPNEGHLPSDDVMTSVEVSTAIGSSKGEKIIIIDACRNILSTNSRDVHPIVYYTESFRGLHLASTFFSAALGETSKFLSFSQLPQSYPNIYASIELPPKLAGNSVYTHLLLEALMCPEGEFPKGWHTAEGIKFFLDNDLDPTSVRAQQLKSLIGDIHQKSTFSPDIDFGNLDPASRPWSLELGIQASSCIKKIPIN